MVLNFKEYMRFKSRGKDTLVYDQLVAEYDLYRGREGVRQIDKGVISEVDDLLVLTSFASRRRCICVGWDFSDDRVFSETYRGNRSLGTEEREVHPHDMLIDTLEFKSFIQSAYDQFRPHIARGALRQALYKVTRVSDVITERTFISLYSAIETLVFEFRQRHHLEFVVAEDAQWKKLKKQLRKAIGAVAAQDDTLSTNPGRREYLYQKLDELNRVSFSTAVKAFCTHYSIDLSDLWPIVGQEIDLSDIRNKFVHGYRFKHAVWRQVISAHENLRWTAERMILAMLGWPVGESNVHQSFLGLHDDIYQSWREDQQQLTRTLMRDPLADDERAEL
jgi:hypothetical protein